MLDSSGIVILQREAAEGLNIQSEVTRPTSNFIAKSPRFFRHEAWYTLAFQKGKQRERSEIWSPDALLCPKSKKDTQGRKYKAAFFWVAVFLHPDPSGTSSKLKAVWGYVLSGNGLNGPIKQLGISLEKYYLLWRQLEEGEILNLNFSFSSKHKSISTAVWIPCRQDMSGLKAKSLSCGATPSK